MITGFKKIAQEDLVYEEMSFDPYTEKFIANSKIDLEAYTADLTKKPVE